MTAYEAIKLLQRVVTDTYTMDDNPRKQCEAVNTLLDYVKHPDPDTGLMKCGCGGAASMVEGLCQTLFWVCCPKCGVQTNAERLPNIVKAAWNTAMSGGKDNG